MWPVRGKSLHHGLLRVPVDAGTSARKQCTWALDWSCTGGDFSIKPSARSVSQPHSFFKETIVRTFMRLDRGVFPLNRLCPNGLYHDVSKNLLLKINFSEEIFLSHFSDHGFLAPLVVYLTTMSLSSSAQAGCLVDSRSTLARLAKPFPPSQAVSEGDSCLLYTSPSPRDS